MGRLEEAERLAAAKGLSFAEETRMLAGADVTPDGAASSVDSDCSRVVARPLARPDARRAARARDPDSSP
jgi:hypothetical protein